MYRTENKTIKKIFIMTLVIHVKGDGEPAMYEELRNNMQMVWRSESCTVL